MIVCGSKTDEPVRMDGRESDSEKTLGVRAIGNGESQHRQPGSDERVDTESN